MKTLKKTLCLVLAVVMAVGVLVLPASADFEDADEIEYKDAVAVLTGLKVLNGVEDGTNFAPGETLTRAMAAKIIHYLATTPATAEKYGGTTTKFPDVAADYWANKSIAYCVSKGIVEGNEKGMFDPEGKLTGYAFAKMLLVAVGYSVKNEELTGDNWAVNVENIAREVGLDNGIDGFDYSADMTREEAAQMAFNALTVKMVKYNGGTEINVNGAEIVIGGSIEEQNRTLNSQNYQLNTDDPNGRKYEGNITTEAGTSDEFGRPTVVYAKGATAVATLKKSADHTYTSGTKYSTILKDLGFTASKEVDVTVYTDGKGEEQTANYEKMTRNAIANKNYKDEEQNVVQDAIGGKGAVVEAFKIDNSTVTLVVVNTLALELTEDNIQEAVVAGENDDGKKAGVNIEVNGNDLFYEGTDFAEGDIVLYTVSKSEGDNGKIMSVKKADKVTGIVTAKGSDYFRVDNTKKELADKDNRLEGDFALANVPAPAAGSVSYDFYVNDYGYVIGWDVTDDGSSSASALTYAYLLAYQQKAGKNAQTDLYTDKAAEDATAKAQLLFLDGTIENVDLAVAKSSGKYYLADSNGKADTSKEITADATTNGGLQAAMFVSYVETEKGYVLTAVSGSDAVANQVVVTKGKANVTVATGSTKYANSASELDIITYNTKDKTYSVTSYNGYKNFAEVKAGTATKAMVAYTKDSEGNATSTIAKLIVLIETAGETKPATRGIYVGQGETTADGTEYQFIVNGKEETYMSPVSNLGFTAKSVYNISFDEDGDIDQSSVSAVAFGISGELNLVDESFIVVGDTTLYLADDYVIYDATGTTGKIVTSFPNIETKTVMVEAFKVSESGDGATQTNLIVIKTAE